MKTTIDELGRIELSEELLAQADIKISDELVLYVTNRRVITLVKLDRIPAAVMGSALGVFGADEQAFEWLGSPVSILNYQSPLAAVLNDDREQDVLDLLGRIKHGVFS